jgi:pyroglutamyl-peptidase
MRVLLTGFEPFGGSDINSSWETASQIGQHTISGVDIEVVRLPVSFIGSGKLIRKLLQTHKPDVLVMLGQRGKGQSVDIERIAINMMDSVNPDNDGYCPHELPIVKNGSNAYFSNVSVKTLKNALENANIPSKVSNSAGLYVCNCTYYHALSEIFDKELPTKAVFVHLPKLSDDFTIELLVESIKKIIEEILKQ